MLKPDHRLALYMEGAFEQKTGKMGLGVVRYSKNPIVCMIDRAHAGEDSRKLTGLARDVPIVASVDEAAKMGAEVLILGIAPPGGLIPESWYPAMDAAVKAGMSLVNGLHDKLAPKYPKLKRGQFVWDVRTEPTGIGVGTGAARLMANKRVLMIGTDMSVGKMTAGLEIVKSANAQGVKASFVATGQVGMVIVGSGVPLDAVRLDFASGAIEAEVVKHESSEIVVVEGQGSLIHPGSSATLPLMRGSCPTHLVLCHRARMETLPRVLWVKVPHLMTFARLYEDLGSACGTFPWPRVVGIALITGHLAEDEAMAEIEALHKETGLPVCDPVRQGADTLLEAIVD